MMALPTTARPSAAVFCAPILLSIVLSYRPAVDAFHPQNSCLARIPRATQQYTHGWILTSTAEDSVDPVDLIECDGDDDEVTLVDPTLSAAAVLEAAVEEPVPSLLSGRIGAARHMIPISVAVTISVFSILEIAESLKELAERRVVGHAHGITVLAALRLGRSVAFFKLLRQKHAIVQSTHKVVRLKSKAVMHVVKGAAVLQTQTEELDEKAEELHHHLGKPFAGKVARSSFGVGGLKKALIKFITSAGVAIAAASLAVVACVVEIVDDMQPGAHHGAALLALSELYYQIRRLKARVKKERDRTSEWRRSTWMGRLWTRIPVGPSIAVAAAVYAAIELYEDLRPGAHHGVAILALAELVENLNRSRLLNQLPNKSEDMAVVAAQAA